MKNVAIMCTGSRLQRSGRLVERCVHCVKPFSRMRDHLPNRSLGIYIFGVLLALECACTALKRTFTSSISWLHGTSTLVLLSDVTLSSALGGGVKRQTRPTVHTLIMLSASAVGPVVCVFLTCSTRSSSMLRHPFFQISVLNAKGERTLEKVHVARHRAGIRPKFADEDEDSSDVSHAV